MHVTRGLSGANGITNQLRGPGRRRAVGGAAAVVGLLSAVSPANAAGAATLAGAGNAASLTNFRTTHLSGRFVTSEHKGISGAIVYLAINDAKNVTPRASQMAVIGQMHTDSRGAFAFTVPSSAAVLAAAKGNHGNVNLIIRAMAFPAASHMASRGTSAPAVEGAPTPPPVQSVPPTPNPCTLLDACPPPPPPGPPVPSADDVTGYGTDEPGHYSAQVATWAGTLMDPFDQYPTTVVSKVDQTENLTLVASKAAALLVPNSGPPTCAQTPATNSCTYNPILLSYAYPQGAVPGQANQPVDDKIAATEQSLHAGTACNGCSPPFQTGGDCYQQKQWEQAYQNDNVPLTDWHTWNGMTAWAHYLQGTTSSIGLAVRDETDNGNWSVQGSQDSSASSRVDTASYGPNWANHFVAEHQFSLIEHLDHCWSPSGDSDWWLQWAEIDDDGWTGWGGPDGQDITFLDGDSQRQQNQRYATRFNRDGQGGGFDRQTGQGYHFGSQISAFGVTLGGETDWNSQLEMHWDFQPGHYNSWLFGHGDLITKAPIVYAD